MIAALFVRKDGPYAGRPDITLGTFHAMPANTPARGPWSRTRLVVDGAGSP
jgi:hypothetical protein